MRETPPLGLPYLIAKRNRIRQLAALFSINALSGALSIPVDMLIERNAENLDHGEIWHVPSFRQGKLTIGVDDIG